MFTPVKLDKTRNFRYGMKALNIIEKVLKKNLATLNFEEMSIEETATIIWAGLVHEDKELTVDKVMDLIDEYSSLNEVSESMGKAFVQAFGDGKK